jgi:hypothetical protein
MDKTKLICSTCGQIIKKNEIHDCTESADKRNQYIVDKKTKPSILNFLKLK